MTTEPTILTGPRIVICRRCDGRGHFDRQVEAPDHHPHRPHYLPVKSTCTCCEGSGRMISTVHLTPYRP